MPFRFHTSVRSRYTPSLTWLHMCSITVMSFCCLIFAWFFFIKQPTDRHASHQLKNLKSLQEKVNLLQARKETFDQALNHNQGVEQTLMALIKDLLPIRVQLDRLVHLLQQNNLTCRVITPTLHDDMHTQNFVDYLIQATAHGSFQAIDLFLRELAVHQQFVITWISIQKKGQRRLELQLCCKVLAQSEEKQ